jgi:hypothetical protein
MVDSKLFPVPSQDACPECGAVWQAGLTCKASFHQMLYWENENPPLGAVHHLMVLAYHLQHPSLLSPEGLSYAIMLLVSFLEHGLMPEHAHKHNRFLVSSEYREWKFHPGSGACASYAPLVSWQMTAPHVVMAGPAHYLQTVQDWSRSVLADLRASQNLL